MYRADNLCTIDTQAVTIKVMVMVKLKVMVMVKLKVMVKAMVRLDSSHSNLSRVHTFQHQCWVCVVQSTFLPGWLVLSVLERAANVQTMKVRPDNELNEVSQCMANC